MKQSSAFTAFSEFSREAADPLKILFIRVQVTFSTDAEPPLFKVTLSEGFLSQPVPSGPRWLAIGDPQGCLPGRHVGFDCVANRGCWISPCEVARPLPPAQREPRASAWTELLRALPAYPSRLCAG